ncbi:MAG: ParB/RepB/Spo0J family partition protein [Planctomycetota bacterium]|jgi:ParB family chromosome partitioning protein
MVGGKKLGKGLGALLPKSKSSKESGTQAIQSGENGGEEGSGGQGRPLQVPISSLTANRDQPRNRFDQGKLDELAASIREQGVLQPIVVRRKEGGGFEIIAGERRTRASQLAGLESVPVIFSDVTDEHMLEAALVENLQREDLNPIEVAMAYQALLEDLGLTHEQVSERMGVSRVSVTNTLRLLGLNEELKEMVSRGTLGAGHARALLGLKSTQDQMVLARRIATEDLSVREVERQVKKLNLPPKEEKGKTKRGMTPASQAIDDYEGKLRERFGTKVKISDKNGKGQISIEYYSHDDFVRISQILGLSHD